MGKQEELFEKLKIGIVSHAFDTVPFDIHANHVGIFSKWAKQFDTLFIGIHGLKNAKARETLFQRAIDEDCTHVLILDVDHIVNGTMLPFLLQHRNAAMISGLITRRSYPFNQVGFVKEKDGHYHNIGFNPYSRKVYSVDACAFGCTLINLKHLQQLDKPYFRDEFTEEVKDKPYNKRSDINLCEMFKAKGFDVLIDTRVQVGHMMPNQIVYPKTQGLWQQIHHLLKDHELMQTEFQVPVYSLAREQLLLYQIDCVWDIGCGNGKKLASILGPHVNKIIGTDVDADCIKECKKLMPEGEFGNFDIEGSSSITCNASTLIICADVLEHLEEPKTFLETISTNILCIFSTPDISTVEPDIMENKTHKHRWTKTEFLCLLKNSGFTILDTLHYKERLPYKGIAAVCRKEK